ncbi:MAG: hypothetical protein QOE35_2343 [Actinomycetota bacterium]|jgi:hypothetical protein
MLTATLALAVLVGLGFRLWMLSGRIGVLDSDGAVSGLMARHIPRELPVFYWGQAYGGSLESFVAAALFRVFSPTAYVLRLVPVSFCAGCSVLCWRIALRMIGPAAARLAGVLFWLPSIGLMWWSTKVGPYWAALFFTLLGLLLLMRVAEDEDWSATEVGALGFTCGLAWWASPQSAYVLAPAAAVLLPRLVRKWRAVPVALAGIAAGAAPWLVFNLRHHWTSLQSPGQATDLPNGYLDHVWGFFTTALPMALGLRQPYTKEWVQAQLAPTIYVAILAGFVMLSIHAFRRRSPLVPVVVVAGMYPFLYALSPFSWFVGLPRYLLFLLPFTSILLASVTGGRTLRSLMILGVACLLLGVGTARILHTGTSPGAPDVAVPLKMTGLEALFADHGVRYAFANYWVAYRVTFELHERVSVTAIDLPRYAPIDRAVRSDPAPGYLFVSGSSWQKRFERELADRAIVAATYRRGPWVLIVPAHKFLPEEAPDAWVG